MSQALGIHFFNPVPVMTLVELIPAIQTSPKVVDRSRAFAQACGKEVTTSKDVPGFISNRLLMPFINEAVMALEKDIASKEDIDKTLRLGMNHPMGPLTLADFIGLDTCLSIMETLYRETADSKYRPAVLLGRMVDAGWFGKKSGKVCSTNSQRGCKGENHALTSHFVPCHFHRAFTIIPPSNAFSAHATYVQTHRPCNQEIDNQTSLHLRCGKDSLTRVPLYEQGRHSRRNTLKA